MGSERSVEGDAKDKSPNGYQVGFHEPTSV